jgi:hypothetical protein
MAFAFGCNWRHHATWAIPTNQSCIIEYYPSPWGLQLGEKMLRVLK